MNDPVKTTFKYDHSEDKVILNSVQDIEPILELNKKNKTTTLCTALAIQKL